MDSEKEVSSDNRKLQFMAGLVATEDVIYRCSLTKESEGVGNLQVDLQLNSCEIVREGTRVCRGCLLVHK